jgi:hypothetical protein
VEKHREQYRGEKQKSKHDKEKRHRINRQQEQKTRKTSIPISPDLLLSTKTKKIISSQTKKTYPI